MKKKKKKKKQKKQKEEMKKEKKQQQQQQQQQPLLTRPDTRHKMRLVCVLFTFENNMGRTDRQTDGRTPLTEMLRRI